MDSIALAEDGTVYTGGQVGEQHLTLPAPVTDVAMQSYAVLAATESGDVYTWGTPALGSTPQLVQGIAGHVVSVGGGSLSGYAVTDSGDVWAWGDNRYGQLGNGLNEPNIDKPPAEIVGLPPIAQVAGGFYHAVALDRDGGVWGWGDNVDGELGPQSPQTTGAPPAKISGLQTVVSVSAGGYTSLVLTRPADVDAPNAVCESADSAWHAQNATVTCAASDSGSGLADPADASFTLSTTVEPGSVDASAQTGTRTVCDNAGNCAAVGPISGFKIDRKAPVITMTRPVDGAWYPLSLTVGSLPLLPTTTAAYSCVDPDSGVLDCAGTVPNGAALDTATTGSKKFTVVATDAAGNTTTLTTNYRVVVLGCYTLLNPPPTCV
jgi:hypothetical protein